VPTMDAMESCRGLADRQKAQKRRSESSGPIQCPSAPCREGAQLLGIVRSDGSVALLPSPMEIDERFVCQASKGRRPEKRFRFTSPCAEGACKQWTGDACSIADRIVGFALPVEDAGLPRCAIRESCRWYVQVGGDACKACRYVITDTRTAR